MGTCNGSGEEVLLSIGTWAGSVDAGRVTALQVTCEECVNDSHVRTKTRNVWSNLYFVGCDPTGNQLLRDCQLLNM